MHKITKYFPIIFTVLILLSFTNFSFAQSTADDNESDGLYCPVLTRYLKLGYRDTNTFGQVSELQQFLVDYYDLEPTQLITTGVFGRITKGYVMNFQKDNNLIISGLVGVPTRRKIAEVCTIPQTNQGVVATTTPIRATTIQPLQCPFISVPSCTGTLASVNVFGCTFYTCTATSTTTTNPTGTNSCAFNNQNVLHNNSIVAHLSSSVPYGNTCTQENRTCNNGNLSGSYLYPTCLVSAPVCTPLPSETQTLSCPGGQTGLISQTRTSSCAAGGSSPVWGSWTTLSNTCQTIVSTVYAPPYLFYVRNNGIPPWTGEVFKNSLLKYVLGTDILRDPMGKIIKEIAEWDWTYYGIPPGTQIGDGTIRDNKDCYGNYSGCYTSGPTTKQEGYNRLASYFLNHKPILGSGELLMSTVGSYLFQHYGAIFGGDIIVQEFGEMTGHIQAGIAFSRGAAIQYGKTWGADWSSWYGHAIRDYSSKKIWGTASCDTCGHSNSLYERMLYSTYMAGAQYMYEEAGSINFFYETLGADGLLQISPIGTIAKNFLTFTRENPDRGTPHVPIAIVLEKNNGMSRGFWLSNLAWDYLGFDSGDYNTAAIFGQLFWPTTYTPSNYSDERGFMVNTTYGWGDEVDVLLDDASQEKLNKYNVLVFSGNISNTPEMISSIRNFLNNGGNIVLTNTIPSHQLIFDTINSLGEGAGKMYLPGNGTVGLSGAIKSARNKFTPFNVSSNVSYQFNKLSNNTWIATFINNDGVTKDSRSAEVIDTSRVVSAVLSKNVPGNLSNVQLLKGGSLSISSEGFSVSVAPGGVSVVKFVFTAGSAVTCVPENPATQTQQISCSTGQTGNITQTRISQCSAGATNPTWTAWTNVSNTCSEVVVNSKSVDECLSVVPNRDAFSFFNTWDLSKGSSGRQIHTPWEQTTGHSLWDGNIVDLYITQNLSNSQILINGANSADAKQTINLIWQKVTGDSSPAQSIQQGIILNLQNGTTNAKSTIGIASTWDGLKSKIENIFTARNRVYLLSSADLNKILNGLYLGKIIFTDVSSLAACVIPQ